jgi:2-keto-4-pentenoate hydratase/2-oxohepta-3-ene-1,7-dioic acid hydratase in catechol pathway
MICACDANSQFPVAETGRAPPPVPSMFTKPRHCIHDHGADIEIPPVCQDDQADYEGELCFIIGKEAKNVPLEKAMEYISAYTCGNDVSSRKWQRDPKLAGGVPQWSYSKSFDTYAPLGPCLLSAEQVKHPSELHLTTVVNGKTRQSSSVGDLLFDCAYLVYFFSQWQTLEKGTVFMTGTPGGA